MSAAQAVSFRTRSGKLVRFKARRNAGNWYVKHTDTDANVIRHYGPFSEAAAKKKAEHLNKIGHKGEAFPQPARLFSNPRRNQGRYRSQLPESAKPSDWMRVMVDRLQEGYEQRLRSGLSQKEALARTLEESTAGAGAKAEFRKRIGNPRRNQGDYRTEHIATKPRGWKVRSKMMRDHVIVLAFPPGPRRKGSGRLLEILHPAGENPACRMKNSPELVIFGNPERYAGELEYRRKLRDDLEYDYEQDRKYIESLPDPTKMQLASLATLKRRLDENREIVRKLEAGNPRRGNSPYPRWFRTSGTQNIYRLVEVQGPPRAHRYLAEGPYPSKARVWVHGRIYEAPPPGGSNPAPEIVGLRKYGDYQGKDEWRFSADGVDQSVLLRRGTNKAAARRAARLEAEARRRLVPRMQHLVDRSTELTPRGGWINPQRRARLTPAEKKVWESAFAYHKSSGQGDAEADRRAWRDLVKEFPRLQGYKGARNPRAWNGRYEDEAREGRLSPGGTPIPVKKTPKKKTPRRRNQSSETEQAVRLYQSFHGKDPKQVSELQESAAMRLDYTALGDLDYIRFVTPAGENAEIEFDGDGVMLASSPDGQQLYCIGGNQNILALLHETSREKDFIDLGEATEVQYVARKVHNKFQPTSYFHKFGEENGVRPSLMFDKLKNRIFFVGGDYRIDTSDGISPGIEN